MAKTQHSETSEKSIERYLTTQAKALGCLSLKYYNPISTGWPDRVVLLPGGQCAWVELKSRGEKPKPLQAHRQSVLRDLGFHVYTCDSKEKVDRMLRIELNRSAKYRELMNGKKEEENG